MPGEGEMRPVSERLPERRTLPGLREAAAGCRGCDLWRRGTQTVFVHPSSTLRALDDQARHDATVAFGGGPEQASAIPVCSSLSDLTSHHYAIMYTDMTSIRLSR